MSKSKDEKLDALAVKLAEMFRLTSNSLDCAFDALLKGYEKSGQACIDQDDHIDSLKHEIDHACFQLLALESPVAVDLRFIYAVIEINDAVERIADYAVIISGTVVNKDLHISPDDVTLKALVAEVSEFFKDSEKAFFLREADHVKQIAEKELKSEKQIHDILLNACLVKNDDVSNLAAFSITHAFYRMLIKIRRIAESTMFYIEGIRVGAGC